MSIWAAENQRNADSADLFDAILREAFDGVTKTAAGHHLFFQRGAAIEEIPSADALIFSHHIAKKIWGSEWKSVLVQLALEPVQTRDALLQKLYEERPR